MRAPGRRLGPGDERRRRVDPRLYGATGRANGPASSRHGLTLPEELKALLGLLEQLLGLASIVWRLPLDGLAGGRHTEWFGSELLKSA